MKTLIISDVHLRVDKGGREGFEDFVSFLSRIRADEFQRIVVLGDLFDFWFEYKHVIFSGYFEVLRIFADLGDAGIELILISGNHDFWAGRFLEEELNFSVYQDKLILPAGRKKVLFIHGDGLNPADWKYRIFKRFARAAPVVWLFRLLHPDWAMAIATALAKGSRHFNRRDDMSLGPEVESLRSFAEKCLADGEADIVVCGHSHYPVLEELPGRNGMGLYVNSGDWLFHRSYVEWEGEAFALKYFDDPKVLEQHASQETGAAEG